MLKQNVPLPIITLNETTGISGSTQFVLQNFDFNMLVGKLTSAPIGTSGFTTCDVFVQTSDGATALGGTTPTWFDLVRFTAFNGTTVMSGTGVASTAYWATFGDLKGNAQYIGKMASQQLSAGTVSKLPLLGRTINVAWNYTGAVGSPNWTLQIMSVDQDYR